MVWSALQVEKLGFNLGEFRSQCFNLLIQGFQLHNLGARGLLKHMAAALEAKRKGCTQESYLQVQPQTWLAPQLSWTAACRRSCCRRPQSVPAQGVASQDTQGNDHGHPPDSERPYRKRGHRTWQATVGRNSQVRPAVEIQGENTQQHQLSTRSEVTAREHAAANEQMSQQTSE